MRSTSNVRSNCLSTRATRAALLAAEKAKRNAETKRATDAARAKHEREASEARAAEAKKAAAALRDAEVARIAAEAEEAEAARRRDEEAAIPESDHSAQEPSSEVMRYKVSLLGVGVVIFLATALVLFGPQLIKKGGLAFLSPLRLSINVVALVAVRLGALLIVKRYYFQSQKLKTMKFGPNLSLSNLLGLLLSAPAVMTLAVFLMLGSSPFYFYFLLLVWIGFGDRCWAAFVSGGNESLFAFCYISSIITCLILWINANVLYSFHYQQLTAAAFAISHAPLLLGMINSNVYNDDQIKIINRSIFSNIILFLVANVAFYLSLYD